MKVFLDDCRPFPRGFILVRSFVEFAWFLANRWRPGVLGLVSFDHDLGTSETGLDCLKLLEKVDRDRLTKVSFHTSNPVGKANMESFARSAGFTVV